ncbi:MAG TPA: hypothetical protein VFP74_20700, partial [Pseudolabrys sp.]|nr:hypothetical protein [Pseudolabrys sp.]
AAAAPVKKSETPAAPNVAAVAPAAAPVAPAPSIVAPEPNANRSQAAVEPKASEQARPKPAPKTTREAEAERRNAPPRPPRSVQRQNGNDRGGLFGIFR